MSNISSQLFDLEKKKQLLVAEETILMRKGLQSDNPNDLIKAMSLYEQRNKKSSETKSIFVDPYYNQSVDGYLTSPQRVNSYTLRRMANTPIIKSIIETRVEEVADFLEPQPDKYSPGFIIRKKGRYFKGDDEVKTTKEDQRKIQLITEFLLRGTVKDELDDVCEDFNTWGRKSVKDTLILDRMATEVVWNNANTVPVGFTAIDAATIFYSDNYNQDGTFKKQQKNVKVPKFVQVHQNKILQEYFQEEMMWGIRNPQSSLYSNGYGESELEVLIATVTAMLQGDAYNANIFKVGSVPSGIMRISGNINPTRLQEFKSNWQSEMSGFQNAKKVAFVEADKMEWQDMSKSNRDMEYSKYQEYLIKLACAVYKISPEEIGFSIQGEGKGSMFQDSGKQKIQYSKDKGLKPLLKFLQRKINTSLISKIDPEFEFVFVGIEMDTEEKELEMAIKKASSFKGLEEVRMERGLSPKLKEGDVILNPVYMQYLQMQQQQKQMDMMGNQESDQFMQDQEENPFAKAEWESNPMAQDFESYVKEELVD